MERYETKQWYLDADLLLAVTVWYRYIWQGGLCVCRFPPCVAPRLLADAADGQLWGNPLYRWDRIEAEPAELAFAEEYLGLNETEGFHWGVIRGGMSSVAQLFVAQMQDYLGLPERMNVPGTLGGNWCWRLLPGELTEALAEKIGRMALLYGRAEARKEEHNA